MKVYYAKVRKAETTHPSNVCSACSLSKSPADLSIYPISSLSPFSSKHFFIVFLFAVNFKKKKKKNFFFWRKDLILLRILLSLNLLLLGEWLSTTLVQISNPLIYLFSPVQVHHSRATWYHKVLFVFLMILAVQDLQSSFMHYLIRPSYQLCKRSPSLQVSKWRLRKP